MNRPDAQIVLFDTPGIHKPTHDMNRRMVEVATRSIGQADVVLWLFDVTERFGPGERSWRGSSRSPGLPVVLALNKIDLVPKPRSCPRSRPGAHLPTSRRSCPVSALNGENVDRLESGCSRTSRGGEELYPTIS